MRKGLEMGERKGLFAGELQAKLRPHIEMLEREGEFVFMGREDYVLPELPGYSVDFYVTADGGKLRICIECDCSVQHIADYDLRRDVDLRNAGYHVIRLRETDIVDKVPSEFIKSEIKLIRKNKATTTMKRAYGENKPAALRKSTTDGLLLALRASNDARTWSLAGLLARIVPDQTRPRGIRIVGTLASCYIATVTVSESELACQAAPARSEAQRMLLPAVLGALVDETSDTVDGLRIYTTDPIYGIMKTKRSTVSEQYRQRWERLTVASSLFPFTERWKIKDAETVAIRTDRVKDMTLDQDEVQDATVENVLSGMSAQCAMRIVSLQSPDIARSDERCLHFASMADAMADANAKIRWQTLERLPILLRAETSVRLATFARLVAGQFEQDEEERKRLEQALENALVDKRLASWTKRGDLNPTAKGERSGIVRQFSPPKSPNERPHPACGLNADGIRLVRRLLKL